ncbi:MAG TPA: hypothetical protein VFW94_10165 [Candidatus Acidoferrales bacterium]|nr:hypothetical protein [Candidatus Acidoferrales bacterium]
MAKAPMWREKLYAIFFELAEFNLQFEREWKDLQIQHLQKLLALGEKPDPGLWQQTHHEFERKAQELLDRKTVQLVEINQRYLPGPIPYDPLAYSYLAIRPGELPDDAENLAAYIHWERHGESLQATTEKDQHGDMEAYRKLARTGEDFRRVTFKKGGVKPFQGDEIHRQLLELILCFEKERLTADELAECLDRYCVCGKDHDAGAARKQMKRLRKDLQESSRVLRVETQNECPNGPPEQNDPKKRSTT